MLILTFMESVLKGNLTGVRGFFAGLKIILNGSELKVENGS